jgi:hypothetical protein
LVIEISCCGADGATATVVVVAPTSIEPTVVDGATATEVVVTPTSVEPTVVDGATVVGVVVVAALIG